MICWDPVDVLLAVEKKPHQLLIALTPLHFRA